MTREKKNTPYKKYQIQDKFAWTASRLYLEEKEDFFDTYEEALKQAQEDILTGERKEAFVVEVRAVVKQKKPEVQEQDVQTEEL